MKARPAHPRWLFSLPEQTSRAWHSLTCGCAHRHHERERAWAGWARVLYPVMCLAALAWFMVRVIPKPIRASYPCQRAAFPLASSLVIWLVGLKGGLWFWQELKAQWRHARPQLAKAVLVLASGLATWWAMGRSGLFAPLAWTPSDPPNTPLGVAKGIFPGRVAWMRDTNATPWNGTGNWWADTTGINQAAADRMLSRTLRGLSGATSDSEAWEKIFRHFNTTRGRGNVGYRAGEHLAIKINCNNTTSNTDADNHADASPQSVLALLRQLVHQAGVPQTNITVYEAPNTSPTRVIPNRIFDKCNAEFPGVVFAHCTNVYGRALIQWVNNAITYSVANGCGRNLPTVVTNATYLINMSLLKGHSTAGVTLTAKNHYGSINTREHTFIRASTSGLGAYSPFVDLIGHQHLGQKTLLFMIDGLYGCVNVGSTVSASTAAWNNLFGGQWSASYFLSLDPVAIDSVGVDFLRAEFGDALGGGGNVIANCDNYLHEAANANLSTNNYFQSGQRLPTLGVHEHWNNATNKQYTRNLSPNGTGIELLALHTTPALTVSLTSPAPGVVVEMGADVTMQAAAAASFALVRRVDFYRGSQLLASCSNAPFSAVWSNAPAGIWSLTAVATDSDGYAVTSSPVSLTVQSSVPVPPLILLQPGHQAVLAGGTARFSVEAGGWPVPGYQWQRGGQTLGGATAPTLTLNSVTTNLAGLYTVAVSNAAGVVTSAVATLAVLLPPTNFTLIPTGALWRYHDKGADPGTGWRALAYDDSGWSNGYAQLGYGDGDERTVVGYGGNTTNRYITTYFRHRFSVMDTNGVVNLRARLLRDDGAVVYLNGTEVIRDNLPGGTILYTTLASGACSDDGTEFHPYDLPPGLLRSSTNVLAVEMHQSAANSSDISFDFELTGQRASQLPQILEHPASQCRLAGGAATFSVRAASTVTVSCRWLFNGLPLGAADADTLELANLTTNHAGLYTAVLSNAVGVVTSAPASLVVVGPPVLQAAWRSGPADLCLSFGGGGFGCTVLASTNLVHWTVLTNLPAGAGAVEFVDPEAAVLPSRFYRVRLEP
jgi:uncharacterized protein (DUF362 family)